MLASWYAHEAARITIAKLWLFDNSIGDAGAAAAAALFSPLLTELHLSHNQIGTQVWGAAGCTLSSRRH